MEEKNMVEIFKEKFFEYIRKLSSFGKNKPEQESDEFILEEKEVLAEVEEYLNTYDAKRKELEESGMTATEWLNNQVEKTTLDLLPDASPEEVDEFKRAVAKGMEERACDLANAVIEDFRPIVEG